MVDGLVQFHRFEGYQLAVGTSNTYNDGSWHFVVAQYDGNNIILNIDNGYEVLSYPDNRNCISSFVQFGNDFYTQLSWFSGYIDDIKIFNTVLTPQQIDYIYNS